MTDDLNPTDEVETAPTQEEDGATSQETPEDGDDLGALKRALEREREERKQAKEELRRLREDEDARREWLAELGYEIAEDEPEPDDDEDDYTDEDDPIKPLKAEIDEFKSWKLEQQAKEERTRFEGDFKEFLGDRSLSDRANEAIRLKAASGQMGPKDLKAEIDAWCEYEGDLAARGRETYKDSKKAPHVSQVGKSATKVPNLDNDDERVEWMTREFENRSAD